MYAETLRYRKGDQKHRYNLGWKQRRCAKISICRLRMLILSILLWQTSVQFSSAPWTTGSLGGHEGRFHRDPPVSSAGAPCEQVWHGQGSPFIDVVHPVFPLLTPASPTLQGALKDSRGEAVLVWGMPAPCKFLSLGSCQKWLLLTHKEVDLDPRWCGVTNIFCFN